MRSKTQIGLVLAGWLLGTLGVAVLAYKIKPATGASTRDDEEFVIPADPVPAALEPLPLPAAEKKEEGPARPDVTAPKAEATLGMPAFPKSGSDENIVLAKAVSSGVAVPAIGGTDPQSVSPLPPPPPAISLPVPPEPPSPDTLPAPRADLLKPIPEPPAGSSQMTVAGFPPPPASTSLPSAITPPPPGPMGSTLTAPSNFCKAPAEPVAPAAPTKPPTAKAIPSAKHLPLTGTHPCKVENQQVTLPAPVRDQLGEPNTLLVTPGPDGCLWLSTPASLERMAERLERKPNGAAQSRAFRRIFLAQSERLAVDRNGQVVLPECLTQVASLRKDGVLIGVGDHVELWDAQRWQQYRFQKYLEGIVPVKPFVIQEEEEWYHKPAAASAPFGF